MLELRDYQRRSLDALESYLRLTVQHGAKMAFLHQTERPYRAVPQLPALPYVCLRVPTGGGKTLMACHALGIVTKEYLQAERAVCLWLVPSNAIREQTLAALRDRQHPYRQAVDAHFGGLVTVMDLAEALYVTRGTLAGETCIIVATLAALRVEDTEGRKVYETAGVLMDHFSGLSAELEALLERNGNGVVPKSLCNVLRLWRPVVIMDEAHNARTQLSFDTLARFNPSCIVEFTATPETTHNPEREKFASNILHHVSAAELKAEDMVKLPIKLETRSEWKEVVAEALRTQRTLEALAVEEERQTGEYIRPIVLLQAQPRHKDEEPLTVEVVRQSLLEDFHIPEEQIAVVANQTRELTDVDLFARDCPIRFIVTQKALAEGWDCSFAYVLCSVAELASTRAVEQILGRVLRLPRATRKRHAELNCAYALAASQRFIEAATSLKDALIENGFQRMEAELFVSGEEAQPTFFGEGTLFFEAAQVVSEAPDLTRLPGGLRERVTFDPQTSTLTATRALTEEDRIALEQCFTTPEARQAVARLYHASHGRLVGAEPIPTDRGPFRVPMLAIRVDGQLELFDEGHFLDAAWRLSECDAGLTEADFPSEYVSGTTGEIDVTDQGKVEVHFVDQIHRQLRLLGVEPGWDVAGLTNWLDRQIPHPDITRTESTLFIHRVLTGLIESRGLTVEQLAGQKFRLRTPIADKIDRHRRAAAVQTFQRALFSAEAAEIEVGPAVCFDYSEDRYAPNWYYDGAYRFRKHFFPLVGELKGDGEEYECAVFLDQLDAVQHWVRNLDRRPDSSFWLQTSTDKFYPDLVALLTDGRILAVESKGEHLWSNDDSKEKRKVGELWADRSNGQCLFVMPKGTDWDAIRAKLT
jgi:type III restriction enzyme